MRPCVPILTTAVLSDSEAHKHDCEHLDWSQMLTHFYQSVRPGPFAAIPQLNIIL